MVKELSHLEDFRGGAVIIETVRHVGVVVCGGRKIDRQNPIGVMGVTMAADAVTGVLPITDYLGHGCGATSR